MLTSNTRRFEILTRAQATDGTAAARKAIKDLYHDRVDELDIRHLWDRKTCQFFRVNFWAKDATTGGPMIRRSAFVITDTSGGSIVVSEVN